MDEQRLPGGKTDGAALVDGTVRRAAGQWTPAVHALLEHLASKGIRETPRPLGTDDRGREVLTFIPGETWAEPIPVPHWAWSETTLVEIGTLLRRIHDAQRDFVPPPDAAWRFDGVLDPSNVICHNDVGPYNVVWSGRIAGLIDWDFARPGTRAWDLAYTAWTFVPLHYPALARSIGAPEMREAPRRLRLLLDSYGLADRDRFVDVIVHRVADRATSVERLADRGDVGMRRLLEKGHLADMRRTVDHVDRHLTLLETALA